jgi:hypothetical protein
MNDIIFHAFHDELEKVAIRLSKLRAAAGKVTDPARKAYLEARIAEKSFGKSRQGKNLARLLKHDDPGVFGQGLELHTQVLNPKRWARFDAGLDANYANKFTTFSKKITPQQKQRREVNAILRRKNVITDVGGGIDTFMPSPYRKSPYRREIQKRRIARLAVEKALRKQGLS